MPEKQKIRHRFVDGSFFAFILILIICLVFLILNLLTFGFQKPCILLFKSENGVCVTKRPDATPVAVDKIAAACYNLYVNAMTSMGP